MSEAKEILKQILNDEKLLNSRAFKDKIYTDEPILRPASQLKRPSSPQRIREMKSIAFTPEAYWKTSAWLFYTQGKSMEDYEDNYAFCSDFTKYFPSYRDLTTEQLRGYFTWRTEVRKSNIKKAPLPFVNIYIYELINCIGSDSPEECFRLLKVFASEYIPIDESISRYTEQWLIDMTVYYELDSSLADDLSDIIYDKRLLTLILWTEHSDDEIFEAIDFLSAYQMKKSLFYCSFPEDMKEVLVRAYKKLSEYFRDKRKNSLCDKLFGNISESKYVPFASSIFYDRKTLRNCEYKLNDIHSFSCVNGKWKCRKYNGNRNRNGHLGDIVKAVDSLMRDKTDFRHKISFDGISKSAEKIIRSEIDDYFEEKRRKDSMKIEIDVSKLSSIRRAADITRDKLIVEEDSLPELMIEKAPETSQKNIENSILDTDETVFLEAMLFGGDIKETANKCGKLLSILCDSINEKLFDIFSDTVINCSCETPEVIEDYAEELKRMLHKE